jgi:hypothetical protein
MSDMVNIPAYRLKQGVLRPYDGKIATDAAHAAAHGILIDLNGRYGIKDMFRDIPHETREDIVSDFAAIIREAVSPGSGPPVLATAETLRDRFATAALSGLMTKYSPATHEGDAWVSRTAYEIADAMLAAREVKS